MVLRAEHREGGLRLLFGPQCSEIEDSISHIRNAILKDTPGLGFMSKLLVELPSLWPVMTEAWPALSKLSGEKQLVTLYQNFEEGLIDESETEASNLLLTPLTVMRHLVDFWSLKDVSTHPAFPSLVSSPPKAADRKIIDSQGFCVGFLAATVVACSRDTREFQTIASNAIRLAVCIGALVDLDEFTSGSATSMAVRCESMQDYDFLDRVLTQIPNTYISCYTDVNSVTITLSDESTQDVKQELSRNGLRAKQISLRGRFHLHKAHREGIDHMIKLCIRDPRFQLPRRNSLFFPLRSNQDGELIKEDVMLHNVALNSILSAKANWWKTVSCLLNNMEVESDVSSFVSIGSQAFVPRSARSRVVPRNALDVRGGDENTSPFTPYPIAAPLPNGTHIFENEAAKPQMSPIAITGMACRYPNADSVHELWELLELGQCTVKSPPEDRFRMKELQREPKGPFWGHFLDRPDAFDHRFFGISAREAESMDPQQRVLLQVAYEAMESAGYCGWQSTELPKDIGCYVGVGSEDYTENVGSRHANAFSATGSLQSFISGRISHYFGWSGPSITLDTACSSAAVAIHQACQALRAKECSIAVAGGVNILTNPRVYQNLAAASFLSPTGACKPFDAAADGYCRGEGAGIVVLRPLKDAIDNGDPILAVIAGSAVNQGSNKSPITVPDSDSQRMLYEKALSLSGVAAEEVTYVEAHGTGTQVGDPIELDSLRKAFDSPHRQQDLYLGSIKGNIGHTETSSGVAGLLKTILMLQQRRIPRLANFKQLNPRIVPSLDQSRLIIPVKSTKWVSNKRVAMVSNYGASGSNAALVVKDHPACLKPEANSLGTLSDVPILVSARSEESLRAYCGALCKFILTHSQSDNIVRDLAYNLANKQNRALPFALAFRVSADPATLHTRLEAIASNTSADTVQKRPSREPPVVLCFGGQNGTTANISKELFDHCALIRTHLMACEHAGQTLGLPSLFPIIFRPDPILDIVHLHFVLFSIQYASAKAWLDAGLRVERIVGHSFGQLTALSVAGSLSIRDGIRLVSERAHLIQSSWGSESGVMLAVEGTEMAVQRLLEHTDHGTDIVCYNGPDQLVLGGTEESILAVEDAIAANKSADNLRARRLDNSHAFHSRLVDSIVPELAEVAESFEFRPPAIPIESCSATGDWSTVTPAKIVEHSRMPVYFQRAVERIAHQLQAPAVWLEAGSASPIIPMVRRILGNSSDLHEYHKLDLGGRHAAGNLATVTSGLWRQGVHVQFWPFHRSQREAFGWVNLPPYQFAKNSHWVSYEPAAFSSHDISTDNEAESLKQTGLLSQLSDGPDEYLFAVNTQDPLYRTCTQGHAVLDQTLCPASMYMELALRAAGCVNPPGSLSSAIMSHIEDLLISSPLVLDPQEPVFVRLSPEGSDPSSPWSFSVFSGNKIGGDTTTHAKGTVCLLGERSRPLARFLSLGRLLDPARGRAIEEGPASSGLKGSTVYDALRRVTNYADYYRGVRQVFASGSEATGLVSILSSATETTCNPILLDNFLQIAGIHVNCLSGREEEEVFVCNAIGETFISSSLVNGEDKASQSTWKVYTSYSRLSKKEIMCDIYVIDIRTDILTAALMGVGFMSVSIRSLGRTLAKLNNITLRDANSISIPSLLPRTEAKEDATVNNEAGGEDGIDEGLISVQTMLRDLFGVGLDELSPTSSLVDIGVDSLMSTEVLAEIKKRFQINISYSTLVEITDIQGLAQHIFPGSRQVVRPSAAVGTVSRDLGAPKAAVTLPVVTDDAISLFSVALASFEETRTSVSHTYDAHWADFFHVVYPQQMTLITAYVIEAFRALGTPLESYEAGEVVPLVSVLPRHEQLRKHLYRILESVNLVRQTSRGQFVRTAISIPLVSSCTIHEQIRYEHPSYALEHDLLRITGPRLADCLTGRADGVSLIFQNAQTRSLVGDVYTQSPVFRSGNLYLVRYLTDLMKSLGNNRPIKVLEIGAGTGGTTKDLLEQFSLLPGTKERLEYTFTDISPSLVAAARKKFAKYDFVRYETLDVENKPPATHHGQYDIVLSTNCVHATRNLVKSCSNIHTLLQPNGILCLVELTRDIFWLDLVFGLLEGWWLFDDGREHALASERLWDQTLRQAGFQWIGWTDNETIESNALRVIVASPSKVSAPALSPELAKKETVTWENRDGLKLLADIFHPDELDSEERQRPIALMIHGGGHVMLSRHDIRPSQTQTLLDAGFLPVSVDYRLCPEVSLVDGPMADVCAALGWVRRILPNLPLLRSDVRPDGNQVVAVGWSTGGHLAMTLPWTAPAAGILAPEAILAFYCPTDYEDPFWSRPNYPFGQTVASSDMEYDLWEGMQSTPISGYNSSTKERPLGGWMSTSDPRSRIALHMNWKGQTLPMLLKGWMHSSESPSDGSSPDDLPCPSDEEVQAVSPQYQIRTGQYRTPTFLIHGTTDDLVPCAQSESTYRALIDNGIEAEVRVVQNAMHLFDLYPSSHVGQEAMDAVTQGYEFLKRHIHF